MRLTSLFLLFMVSMTTLAQRTENETITVKGEILEEGTNYPLEYATVSFFNPQNELVTGGISDGDGNYSIEVPKGLYRIQFDFISYQTKNLTQQRLTKNITLPAVSLALDAASLDEVVVRAETTEVQIRLDKKIYNIGKDLTTAGATVSDALNNVPSVTVDVEGAISLRGNENVRILINGKPSAIAGFGSTDALRQLPADAIERVEVITSPSARYDAEGTAGILNIILRKEKTLGLNGSVQTTIGAPLNSNISANVNLRTDKFNLFNTTGFRYSNAPGNAFFDNTYKDRIVTDPITGEQTVIAPTVRRIIEDREYDRERQGFNTNLGLEYFLTENSSITGSVFFRLGDDEDVTVNDSKELDNLDFLTFNRIRTETETEEDTSYQFSLNYANNFNDEGHKLTADLQYENDNETQRSYIDERNIFPNNEIFPAEDITTKEEQNEYLAQIDYVRPIGENAQFEAGYRGNFEKSIVDYELLEENGVSGNFMRNDSLSNKFTYQENVNALYSQYGNKFGKFSFLLGLRLENTQLKGNVEADDLVITETDDVALNFDKNYLGLFPTINLTFELKENENITLGYNRRINRPRGFFINPFPSRSSETNIFQGNPNLDPAYSNAFDIGYLKRWSSNLTLTGSIYYQHETDSFERVQEDTGNVTPNGVPIIRTIPFNLSTNDRYGVEAGILYNPAKWLRLNGSFNYFNFKSEGSFNGVDYGTENSSWFARGSAKVTLPSKIDWQTTAFYRGPSNTAQSESEGILSVNLAFSKDIMNDNGTLGLNVSDLLNSRKRRTFTETNTFTSDSEFQWRQRQINLSFTYRFNQKKQRQRNPQNSNDDDGDFEG
ncbi:outer membrane beta-barrel family protein [Cochleicola gelatinilyticus]|uniref:TonB-dependent receptor n=1 Tax=Cochleicola gelatinilyticus TaxID=1763537 RepID=A0A167HT55_9FLAO|nr:outer membrane beta-barrel family protein [Cochleicola gelatinilyticus]OAB78938.1 TonB-dependent receptor [Cochleicola gelatinilyticus]